MISKSINYLSIVISIPPLLNILGVPSDATYIMLALSSIVYFILIPIDKTKRGFYLNENIFLIATLVPLMWLCSSFIGAINGAPSTNAIRNFFGMNLYWLLIPIYLSKPTIKDIEKSLLLSNLLVFISLVLKIDTFTVSEILAKYSDSDFRLVYSASAIISVPTVGICLNRILTPSKKSEKIEKTLYLHMLLALISAILVFSKGILLSLFIVSTLFLFMIIIDTRNMRQYFPKIFYVILIILVSIFIIFSPIFDLIIFMYSNRESSNSVRTEQFSYLMSELHFLGAGLGTELTSGYKRDDTGYGFELTLVNVLQKMGVFSLLYFVITLLVVLKSAFGVILNAANQAALIAFLCITACLVSGAFNPLLFSPFSVILQLIAIYLMFTPNPGIKQSDESYNFKNSI